MTLLEIKEYIEAEQKASRLRKGFVARCLQIRKYLEKVFFKAMGPWDKNPYFAQKFKIVGDEVRWHGKEVKGDSVDGSFPLVLLTYTEEQLNDWAEDEVSRIEKKREEERIKEEEESGRDRERYEFDLYQQLKKKFEGQ